MANHTPEPWRVEPGPKIIGNGEDSIGMPIDVARLNLTVGHYESEEVNARRIVACVNACAGIPDDALNDLDGTLNKIKAAIEINGTIALADDAKLAAVTAQRDELLQTLTAIANISHHGALIGKSDIYDAFNEIRRLTIKHWDSAECCSLQSGAIAKCEVKNDEQ